MSGGERQAVKAHAAMQRSICDQAPRVAFDRMGRRVGADSEMPRNGPVMQQR